MDAGFTMVNKVAFLDAHVSVIFILRLQGVGSLEMVTVASTSNSGLW
jgi:hypothetical protein